MKTTAIVNRNRKKRASSTAMNVAVLVAMFLSMSGNVWADDNNRKDLAAKTGTETDGSKTTGTPIIYGNIYGGAEYAVTDGNTNVTINGGNISGEIFGGGLGSEGKNKEASADITGTTNVTINGGTFLLSDENDNAIQSDHNIFGGGKTACVVTGTATVTLNHGMVLDTDQLEKNTSTPKFSVFGGGYGINTSVNNTVVNAQIGKTDDYPDKSSWENVETSVKNTFRGGNDEAYRCHRIETFASLNGVSGHTYQNIFGGGYSGVVTKAEVNISGHTFCYNVFGGGLGSRPAGTLLTGKETYGKVGSTQVNINGGIVTDNIFGGGAGVEPTSDKESVDGIARVTGQTEVTIAKDAIVIGKVYGGGDIANVGSTEEKTGTTVNIAGGYIMGQIFGGGNGRLVSQHTNYKKLGAIYGDTKVNVTSDEAWIWNRIYGGGQNGTIYGNTYVNITEGNLGHDVFGGGWGNVDDNKVTSADVAGNTYVNIEGGLAALTQRWNEETLTWYTSSKGYSPQYDPDLKKFSVSHNIYGGGNIACEVKGTTNIKMVKGIVADQPVKSNYANYAGNKPFESEEWHEVYKKYASPQFSVFGGGYGEHTFVNNNSNVDIALAKSVVDISHAESVDKSQLHRHFYSRQAFMDVFGGGYNGTIKGKSNVTVDGESFCRRVFGGGFMAPVHSSNVIIKKIDANDVFGGGLMGDVGFADSKSDDNGIATITIGGNKNSDIYIHGNIYGGNDVSGYIYNKATLNLFGGTIMGNVYGAGNGNYFYALGTNGETKVTPNEGKNEKDLVYSVPARIFAPEKSSTISPAEKIVNINTWAPLTQAVEMNLKGAEGKLLTIQGDVYGGGNSATVGKINGSSPEVKVNIGSHVKINGLYLGCDGNAMFEKTTAFMEEYEKLNDVKLDEPINWSGINIEEKYLPVKKESRAEIYPHLLDLYFQPIEMNVQPTVNFAADLKDCTIGTFVCGGNRGNMNVEPKADGNIVNYTFPANLVITDKIVGGCNYANLDYKNITHVGGYLLGERGKQAIKLVVNCKFIPSTNDGVNVYGGCYSSGTIKGDVSIKLNSDMKDGRVYGAGYGSKSYVEGNTEVLFGETLLSGITPSAIDVYGGGQMGNVIGNTKVWIKNGKVSSGVYGGSYSGYMWGSSHVLIGYPEYYVCGKTGTYNLNRADKWNGDKITSSINLIAGDIIATEVYDAIKDAGKVSNFTKVTQSPSSWNDVNISIGKAVYGGGYAEMNGSDLAAGTYTLKKYDADHNFNNALLGYGGNTTILICDEPNKEHISISPQKLSSVKLNDEDDIAGYFYLKVEEGKENYTYIMEPGVYKYGKRKDLPNIGTDTNIYQYEKEGGIFGDGRMSFAEGFRSGEVHNYGFASHSPKSAKLLNSFQRMDMLRVTDSAIKLLGASDYTEGALGTVPYSISRVAELQMNAEKVVMTTDLSQTKTRNYIEFSNKNHYCGAVKSSVDFTSPYRNTNCATTSETETYLSRKKTLTGNANAPDESRNSATSPNMLGLNTGYALNIQNVYTKNDKEETFYGPIVGVAEIKLDIKDEEGGAFVYAANIHEEKTNGQKTFLETSGNFVYPYSADVNKYLLDDCLDHYVDSKAENTDAHYWYIDGYAHFYNAHITGYTYNKGELTFFSDKDNTVCLEKAQAGQQVYLKKLTWNLAKGKTDTDFVAPDLLTTPEKMIELGAIDACGNKRINEGNSEYRYDNYNLSISAPGDSEGHYTEETQKSAYWSYLPLTENFGDDANRTLSQQLPAQSKNPPITFRLVDNAKNAGQDYYKKYMSKPAIAAITLMVKALEPNTDNAEEVQKQDWFQISRFYKQNENGEYVETKLDNYNGGKLYYKNTDDSYNELNWGEDGPIITSATQGTKNALYTKNVDSNSEIVTYHPATAIDNNTTYFTIAPKYYTYTVYLTIDYVQGPDFTGTPKVVNCALPGEYIAIDKSDIKNSSSMAEKYVRWTIGKREKNNEGKWTFKEDEKFTFNVQNNVVSTDDPMLAGKVRNFSDLNRVTIPAYYFMDGYGVQAEYCFDINGNKFTFPIDMDDDSYLTVHNYHQMKKADDLYLNRAAKRAQDGEIAEPRIYISDTEDMSKFGGFLNSHANGENMQFFLQNNMTLTSAQYPSTAIFNGIFHGDGHIITLPKGKSLFNATGTNASIHNLGLAVGKISNGDNGTANAKYHCCYTYDNKTVYQINGTSMKYSDDSDWRYGRVAYDLNQYYLEARNGNVSDYVSNYYANGDYLYADYSDANHFYGSEYLRTKSTPNYDEYEEPEKGTRHDMSHKPDASRYDEEHKCYKPLFEENLAGGPVKNDFLFFGQIEDASTKNSSEVGVAMPSAITHVPTSNTLHAVSDMTNRVYRAVGYYGNTTAKGFYYNPNGYAHDNGITAINFSKKADLSGAFYPPMSDFGLVHINTNDAVTRNLLVYTHSKTDHNDVGDPYHEVSYIEGTPEEDIKAHLIDPKDSEGKDWNAALLHLVDKQTFIAPIKFNADKAWYVRNPESETGYVEEEGKSWESISLPFAPTKSTLAGDGIQMYDPNTGAALGDKTKDVTFFYKNSTEDETLGHHYWFRLFDGYSGNEAKFTTPASALSNGGFAAYTPYLVSFPGSRYYEFDMTGQSIIFSAENAEVGVTVDATVPVAGAVYHAAFINNKSGDDTKYAIPLTGDGDKFKSREPIYAFRGYMTKASAGAKFMAREDDDVIYINTGIRSIENLNDDDNASDVPGEYLRIYDAGGHAIGVESTYDTKLSVYSSSGQITRILDVRAGTGKYSGFASGLYIIGTQKLYVK